MAITKSVALIAPVHSYRASVYLTAAEKHGISVVFISDGTADVVPGIINGIRVDFSEPDQARQAICAFLTHNPVQAVIAPDEKYVALAAQISEQLGLPHNPIDSLNIISNKHLARLKLKQTGHSTVPDFHLINLQDNLTQQLKKIKFPCVAKPLNLSASRGVIRANNRSELLNALARIQQILRTEFKDHESRKVVVEEYIDGTEYALEGYLSDNDLEVICIFDKPEPLTGPYFEETYYITPSRLDEFVQIEIRNTVLTACRAYDLQMGPIHAEVRISGGKIWILEIAARSIGGDCSRIFELATQSSLEEFVVCRAVGQSIKTLNFQHAAGILMIPVSTDGILKRVEGVTDALSIDNILDVRLDVREGEKLVCWPEGGKYPGFIYSVADSPEHVETALRQAHSRLRFVCMPDLPVRVG